MSEIKILLTLLAAIIFASALDQQTVKYATRTKRFSFSNPIFSSVFNNADPSKSLTQKFFEGSRNNDRILWKNGNINTDNTFFKPKETYWNPNINIPKSTPKYEPQKSRNPTWLQGYGVPKPHDIYGVPENKPKEYSMPKFISHRGSLPKTRISTPFREYTQPSFPVSEHKGTYYAIPGEGVNIPLPKYGPPKNFLESKFAEHPTLYNSRNPTQPYQFLQHYIEIPVTKFEPPQIITDTFPTIPVSDHFVEYNSDETNGISKNFLNLPLPQYHLLNFIVPNQFIEDTASYTPIINPTSSHIVPPHYVETPFIQSPQAVTDDLLNIKVVEYEPQEFHGLPNQHVDLPISPYESGPPASIPLIPNTHLDGIHQTYGVPNLEVPIYRRKKRSSATKPISNPVFDTEHFKLLPAKFTSSKSDGGISRNNVELNDLNEFNVHTDSELLKDKIKDTSLDNKQQRVKRAIRTKRFSFSNPIFTSVFHNADPSKSLTQKFFEGSRSNDRILWKNDNDHFFRPQETFSIPNRNIPKSAPVYDLPKSRNPILFQAHGVPKPHDIYGLPVSKSKESSIPQFISHGGSLPKTTISTPFRKHLQSSFQVSEHKETYHAIPGNSVNIPSPEYAPPYQFLQHFIEIPVTKYEPPTIITDTFPTIPVSDHYVEYNSEQTNGISKNYLNPLLPQYHLSNSIVPNQFIEYTAPYTPIINRTPYIVSPQYIDTPFIQLLQAASDDLLNTKAPSFFVEYQPQQFHGLSNQHIDLAISPYESGPPGPQIPNTHLDGIPETYGVPNLEVPISRRKKRSSTTKPIADSAVNIQHFKVSPEMFNSSKSSGGISRNNVEWNDHDEFHVHSYKLLKNKIKDTSFENELLKSQSFDTYDASTKLPYVKGKKSKQTKVLDVPVFTPYQSYNGPYQKSPKTENYDIPIGRVLAPHKTYVISIERVAMPTTSFDPPKVEAPYSVEKYSVTNLTFYVNGHGQSILLNVLVPQEKHNNNGSSKAFPSGLTSEIPLTNDQNYIAQSNQNIADRNSIPKISQRRTRRSAMSNSIFESVFRNIDPSKSLSQKFFEGSYKGNIEPWNSQYYNVRSGINRRKEEINSPFNKYGVPNTPIFVPHHSYVIINQNSAKNVDNCVLPNIEITKPFNEYGLPKDHISKPHVIYGIPHEEPTKPVINYGPPKVEITKPFNEYGVPKPHQTYGLPNGGITEKFKNLELPKIEISKYFLEYNVPLSRAYKTGGRIQEIAKPADTNGPPKINIINHFTKYEVPKLPVLTKEPYRVYEIHSEPDQSNELPIQDIPRPFQEYNVFKTFKPSPHGTTKISITPNLVNTYYIPKIKENPSGFPKITNKLYQAEDRKQYVQNSNTKYTLPDVQDLVSQESIKTPEFYEVPKIKALERFRTYEPKPHHSFEIPLKPVEFYETPQIQLSQLSYRNNLPKLNVPKLYQENDISHLLPNPNLPNSVSTGQTISYNYHLGPIRIKEGPKTEFYESNLLKPTHTLNTFQPKVQRYTISPGLNSQAFQLNNLPNIPANSPKLFQQYLNPNIKYGVNAPNIPNTLTSPPTIPSKYFGDIVSQPNPTLSNTVNFLNTPKALFPDVPNPKPTNILNNPNFQPSEYQALMLPRQNMYAHFYQYAVPSAPGSETVTGKVHIQNPVIPEFAQQNIVRQPFNVPTVNSKEKHVLTVPNKNMYAPFYQHTVPDISVDSHGFARHPETIVFKNVLPEALRQNIDYNSKFIHPSKTNSGTGNTRNLKATQGPVIAEFAQQNSVPNFAQRPLVNASTLIPTQKRVLGVSNNNKDASVYHQTISDISVDLDSFQTNKNIDNKPDTTVFQNVLPEALKDNVDYNLKFVEKNFIEVDTKTIDNKIQNGPNSSKPVQKNDNVKNIVASFFKKKELSYDKIENSTLHIRAMEKNNVAEENKLQILNRTNEVLSNNYFSNSKVTDSDPSTPDDRYIIANISLGETVKNNHVNQNANFKPNNSQPPKSSDINFNNLNAYKNYTSFKIAPKKNLVVSILKKKYNIQSKDNVLPNEFQKERFLVENSTTISEKIDDTDTALKSPVNNIVASFFKNRNLNIGKSTNVSSNSIVTKNSENYDRSKIFYRKKLVATSDDLKNNSSFPDKTVSSNFLKNRTGYFGYRRRPEAAPKIVTYNDTEKSDRFTENNRSDIPVEQDTSSSVVVPKAIGSRNRTFNRGFYRPLGARNSFLIKENIPISTVSNDSTDHVKENVSRFDNSKTTSQYNAKNESSVLKSEKLQNNNSTVTDTDSPGNIENETKSMNFDNILDENTASYDTTLDDSAKRKVLLKVLKRPIDRRKNIVASMLEREREYGNMTEEAIVYEKSGS